jgi:hypothetical protein
MVVIPFTQRWRAIRAERELVESAAYFVRIGKMALFRDDFVRSFGKSETGALRLGDCQEKVLKYVSILGRQNGFDSYKATNDGRFTNISYSVEGNLDFEDKKILCSAELELRWYNNQNWPLDSKICGMADDICIDPIQFRFFPEKRFHLDRHLDKWKCMSFISDSRVDLKSRNMLKETWNYIGKFCPSIFNGQEIFIYAHNTQFDGPEVEKMPLFGGIRKV